MGFEVQLQALPSAAEGGPLGLVAEGRLDANVLGLTPSILRDLTKGFTVETLGYTSPDSVRLAASLAELLQARPGIERRACDLDRRFAWLRWTLAAARPYDEPEMAATAVDGDRPFDPPASGGQGFPTRWSPPDVCETALVWLSEMSEGDLAAAFDPDRMAAARLYKWPQQRADPDRTLRAILADFAALRSFYADVVEHGEAVLVLKD